MPSTQSVRRTLPVAAALAVAALLVFLPVLDAGFVTTDDPQYIYANPRVAAGLTAEGIHWAFTTTEAANYHPLAWLSHMLDVSLFGPEPRGHHAVSVALHAANAILLFLALRALAGSTWRAAFVAGLFAVHPMHVESVAWISERKDVLCAFFFLLTLCAYAGYARRPTPARYAGVLLGCLLALLSKPMAVTLPFLLLLLDWWPLGRLLPPGAPGWRSGLRLAAEKLPMFAMSAITSVVTLQAQEAGGARAASLPGPPFVESAGTAAMACLAYLRKLAWPSGLAMYYPAPPRPFSGPAVAGAAVLLLSVTAAAWLLRRRAPWFPAGWAWFLGMLVPVIGLVPVGEQFIADRYTYLPAIGLFVAAAWGIPAILPATPRVRAALAGTACAALAVLGWAAHGQAGAWRDSATLYLRAIAGTGDNWFAEGQLAEVRYREGRLPEAADRFARSIALHPFQPGARNNFGAVLAQLGRPEEAMAQIRAALEMDPSFAEAHNNLGNLQAGRGEREAAERSYLESIRLRPDYPDPYLNLGTEYLAAGRSAEAAGMFREFLSLRPGDPDGERLLAEALTGPGGAAPGGR